jgi:hypothetical protein
MKLSPRMQRFKDSGLLGCFDDTGITSENYKDHLYEDKMKWHEFMEKNYGSSEIDSKIDEEERKKKLPIALAAYRILKSVIDELEKDGKICCHWHDCITVDDEFFTGADLREGDK